MPAYFRFRLKPNASYGYDVLTWAGVEPPPGSPKMVADITTDRTYAPNPGFPPGSIEYQYPFTYVLEDTDPEAAFSIWWLITQYVSNLGNTFPTSWKLMFGPLPETPVLTEMFEISVRIDGITQAGISVVSATSDGTASISFDASGFAPNQTYRVTVSGDKIDIDTPDPGEEREAFWTRLIGTKEVI